MTLSDYVSFVCPVVGQTDTVSQGLCKTFVQRRYQMIYDMRNWKDAIDLVTGLSVGTTGTMDYPAGIDRIITIRGNGNHLIIPSDAAQVMEIDPTLFERTGDPQIWFDYVAVIAGTGIGLGTNDSSVHRIKFLPTPTVSTPIILQGTRDFVQLTHDLDEPVIRGLDETIIAYATGDMLRRQRQYQKAQLLYQEAAAALRNAIQSETEAAGYNARVVPWPEEYGSDLDYGLIDRLVVEAGSPTDVGIGGGMTVISVAYSATISVDAGAAPSGGLLVVQVGALTGNVTLANPTNPTNRQRLEYVLKQDATGGRTLSLGTKFRIPSSSSLVVPVNSSNNPDFTAANSETLLMAEYDSGTDKWDVIAFVPGY